MFQRRSLQAFAVLLSIAGAVFVVGVPVGTQGPGGGQGPRIDHYAGRQIAAGEVLVKFRDEARNAPLGPDVDADRDEPVGDGTVRRVHSRSQNTGTLLARLSARPDVELVEPNYIVYAYDTVPNDQYFGLLWGLKNVGQTVQGTTGAPGADIEATLAWDKTVGSRDSVVAVVDTGIDYTHPDLAANAWQAASAFSVTVGGRSVACPQFSRGFNAITMSCDPMDDNGHGTHVSGTIGAAGNNTAGVVGVNWVASVMGLKFLNANGSGTTADAINAIEFAIQAKQALGAGANVRVLSNSWGGGGFSQLLLDEIKKAGTADMLFAAAAGNAGTNNDATPNYPSNYAASNVVAVAATDANDRLASFSNYGATTVDLAAPGVNIASTYPGSKYAFMSGSSMATPHVSGAAALMLAACGTATNTATLIGSLLDGVDKIASLAGVTATGGRLNVNTAIARCQGVTPTPIADFTLTVTPASRTVGRGGSTTYTVTVTPSNGFGGVVSLALSGLPSSASASFSPPSITGQGSSTLTVATTKKTTPKTYRLQVTGTSGTLSHPAAVALSVTR